MRFNSHAKMQQQQQHVVAIPYPAQGHINPMLQLCQQLLPHGFTFTFVTTQHIHQRVQSAHPTSINRSESHGNKGIRDDFDLLIFPQVGKPNPIRMVFVEGGCAPEKHAHIATAKEALTAAQDMKGQVEQLLSSIMEEQPVAFILTDILFGWSNATASKFGVPWVCFWAASAATFAAFDYFAGLAREEKHIPIADKQDGEVLVIDDIPGLPPTLLHDLPKTWDDTGKLVHPVLHYFNAADQPAYLLLNTFAELEEHVLQALSKRYRTLAVGPLIASRYMLGKDSDLCPDRTTREQMVLCPDETTTRPSLFKEDRTCLDWLHRQAPSSVLFISFGSISARSKEQLKELAEGVQASGCPFLWVHRPDCISSGFTPETAHHENGLVVPWAPQLDVLSHPAVGGFITHCGWNSVMESVAMGVPMLCWADTGERLSNQRFTVQFWKCGLDMVADGRRHMQHIDEEVLVQREDIEKSIRCLMLESSGAPIRAQAAHLRDVANQAFNDSYSHLSQLMNASFCPSH